MWPLNSLASQIYICLPLKQQTDLQTAAAFLTRPASHTHQPIPNMLQGQLDNTKVILHISVHMYTSIYIMHTLIHTHKARTHANCRSEKKPWELVSNSLYWMQLDDQMNESLQAEKLIERRLDIHLNRQDNCKPFTDSTFFSLLCAIMSTEPWGISSVCEQIKNQCNDMAH